MNKNFMPGKHFLQLPGPSNVPDRILRAMSCPTIDHRGPDFTKLAFDCIDGMKTIFKTNSNVVIFPASGTGAWEAALVNTLDEDDLVNDKELYKDIISVFENQNITNLSR